MIKDRVDVAHSMVLRRIFAVPRSHRVFMMMFHTTMFVTITGFTLAINPFASVVLGVLPLMVVVYDLVCIVVGTYVAQGYLAVHPVSWNYAGDNTQRYVQWLTETMYRNDYEAATLAQYAIVAMGFLLTVFLAPVASCIIAVLCYMSLRKFAMMCGPLVVGERTATSVRESVHAIQYAFE